MQNTVPIIITADIGGTNTRLAVFDGSDLRDGSIARYSNKGDVHIYDHLARYADETGITPDLVSLALAGPVNGDTGRMTNLNWDITTSQAAGACGASQAVLLNDLQAQGHALPFLPSESVTQVFGAPSDDPAAPKLVLGLGTGVNIAAVHCLPDGQTFVPPAEAGHVTFASQIADLHSYSSAMHARLGHAAYDDILSGRGVENAYRYTAGVDLAAEDIMALRQKDDPNAVAAVDLLITILGEYAGDLALVHFARGGIFLVGGVSRALLPYLQGPEFADTFTAKGRFSQFMQAIPVACVQDDYAALTGACRYALQTRT